MPVGGAYTFDQDIISPFGVKIKNIDEYKDDLEKLRKDLSGPINSIWRSGGHNYISSYSNDVWEYKDKLKKYISE